MAKLAAKTYGESLFELAVEENKLELLLEEVQMLQQILTRHEDLCKLMTHPKIGKEEKMDIMENILKGRVSDELTGFLNIIIAKGRFKEIFKILEYFIARVKEDKKIGVVYVSSAVELKEYQKKALTDKLISITSYETMEMNYNVDATLIGGMVIRIGDRVVDSSIKNQLSDLKSDLLKIQLA